MEGITKRAYRFIVGATLLTTFSFAQIQKDKYYHFTAGVVSGYTGYKTVELPIATSFVVGFGKESLDYLQYGKFDSKDLLATTLGGVAVSLTIKLINKSKDEKINNRIVRSYRKHERIQRRQKRRLLKKDI